VEVRVLFVIDGLGTGGAERSLAEMLPGLRDSGIVPLVACLHLRDLGVQRDLQHQGFDVRVLTSTHDGSWIRALPSRVRAIRGLISSFRPDVVHTTLFASDISGRLAAARTPAAVISSVVNTSYAPVRTHDPNIRPGQLRVLQAIDSLTAHRLTTHFHAISHAVKRAAVTALRLPPQRITVIERGRDPARLGLPGAERRVRTRARFGLDADDEVLINVARHEYQKGQRFLLEAVARASAEHPRLVLLVAGREGHSSSELERLRAHLGLGDRVRFLGHTDDVPDLLAASDLFVFPSIYEGLGGAVIEAMALKLPVIASDNEAIREVVEPGRSATLVQPGSPVQLAEAIHDLLVDRSKTLAFGARGREIYLERFTLGRSVERMAKLYQKVAGAGAQTPRVFREDHERLRVLHVVATDGRRGAEVFASDLISALNDASVEQRVAVLRGNGAPIAFEATTRVLGSSGWNVPGLRMDLRAFRALRALISDWSPQVIQAHGGEPLKYAVPAVKARSSRVVYRRIGATPDSVAGPARRATYGQLMRRAAKIVAVAEAARRETVERFGVPIENVLTIPNGVDPTRFASAIDRQAARQSLGISQDARVLLSVGALTWEKDPLAYVSVASLITSHLDDAVFLMAGDGPLRRQVERSIKKRGLTERVRLLGSRGDIANLMAASDVFVLTSCTEGMPAVLIEAGFASLPVAAYAIGGVPEVVIHGETGLLAPPGDVLALDRCVHLLLARESLRRKLGKAARHRCQTRFDIKAIARSYLALYEELSGVVVT
jgi:glycosyltransferase involved in cell wall biosynthesis